MRIFIWCQSIFPQIIYYLRREDSNFTLEKVGAHHLKELFSVNINNMRTNQHHMPPDLMHGVEHNIIWVVFLPQNDVTNVIGKPKSQIQRGTL